MKQFDVIIEPLSNIKNIQIFLTYVMQQQQQKMFSNLCRKIYTGIEYDKTIYQILFRKDLDYSLFLMSDDIWNWNQFRIIFFVNHGLLIHGWSNSSLGYQISDIYYLPFAYGNKLEFDSQLEEIGRKCLPLKWWACMMCTCTSAQCTRFNCNREWPKFYSQLLKFIPAT